MKEIEFRVWDGEKMNNVEVLDIENERAFTFLDWYDLSGVEKVDYGKNEKGILMQFTGLEDRNDKKIFEGDIVKVEYGEDEFVSEVKWNDCDCLFGFVVNNEDRYFYSLCGAMLVEVLGNVHENPELLTQSKK